MRRWQITITAIVSAGLIANVAVAWITSAFSDPQRLTYAKSGWLGKQPHIRGYWYRYRSFGRSVAVYYRFDSAEPRAGPECVVDAQGWPWPSLCAKYTALLQPRWKVHLAVPLADQPRTGSSQPSPQFWVLGSWRAPPVLALCPAWPGFASNWLFYTAIVASLLLGPSAVRRLLRKRRNRCLACGYPLGQSAFCTECGNPVLNRAVA